MEKMGPAMDLRCFFGTFVSVLRGDGVVEGGTGAMQQPGTMQQPEAMQQSGADSSREEKK